MEKCQNFQRFGKTLPDLLSFGGWVLVFCCSNNDKPKFVRVLSGNRKGGKKANKGRSPKGGQDGPSNTEVEVKSPNLVPKPKRPNPMDRKSERCHQHSTYGCRSTHEELGPTPPKFFELEEPDRPPRTRGVHKNCKAQGTPQLRRLWGTRRIPRAPWMSLLGSGTGNQPRERVRNGGRSFLRVSGSFPLYSRSMMRNIHTLWGRFREKHPAAVKYAKWGSLGLVESPRL